MRSPCLFISCLCRVSSLDTVQRTMQQAGTISAHPCISVDTLPAQPAARTVCVFCVRVHVSVTISLSHHTYTHTNTSPAFRAISSVISYVPAT